MIKMALKEFEKSHHFDGERNLPLSESSFKNPFVRGIQENNHKIGRSEIETSLAVGLMIEKGISSEDIEIF
jgi:hypothetical protein